MAPSENIDSRSSIAAGVSPSGTSNTRTPSTELPGLIWLRNASLPGRYITAVPESALYSRRSASSSVWFESANVADSVPMLVTVTCTST
ncbi:hypothetical protein BJF90_07305 [Pseudonocardia sp. CNS-004]|nr:hypothetical protein BJF90_07305 [Pseudonocardia sp. CNS-004]